MALPSEPSGSGSAEAAPRTLSATGSMHGVSRRAEEALEGRGVGTGEERVQSLEPGEVWVEREQLPSTSGTWRVEATSGADDLLAAAGAPWILRKLILHLFSRGQMTIWQQGKKLAVRDDLAKQSEVFKYDPGVEVVRKDRFGITLTETCEWLYEPTRGHVFTVRTSGYYGDRHGPVVSNFFLNPSDEQTLVSEILFRGAKMVRYWVRTEQDVSTRFARILSPARDTSPQEGEEVPAPSPQASLSQRTPTPEGSLHFKSAQATTKILVYGKGGWLGTQLAAVLAERDVRYVFGRARLENYEAVEDEVAAAEPTHVLNAAGITWDPLHKGEQSFKPDDAATRANLCGVLNLATICWKRKVHLTHVCHMRESTSGADPVDTCYIAWTKNKAEALLAPFIRNTLVLRLGLAINPDLKHPRCAFTRLCAELDKGRPPSQTPMSVSVLPELLPIAIDMAISGVCGAHELVNHGKVTESALMRMYRAYVLPHLSWKEELLDNSGIRDPTSSEFLTSVAEGLQLPRNYKVLDVEDSLRDYIFAPNSPYPAKRERKVWACGLVKNPLHWSACFQPCGPMTRT